MADKDIEIRFVKKWPDEEIIHLYKEAGWWKETYKKSTIQTMIKGSFVFAVIIDRKTKKAIGMGRVLSDGVSDAYIQDLMILPQYRKQEIGKKLLVTLLSHCLKQKIMWIGLIAEPGTEPFYHSAGLQQMKNHVPMRYQLVNNHD
ncbi:MAG: GNAT family N-acetyltransferase [Euryarchaeota archaeon]|nr:GNAT family N-acetyltransferase [Euryarchaeota archaeon]